ncbi:MAG: redoxin domain-containing protein [Deltaproteobacteria bacterium]|nr:redoxin domain-containing protein [Deltaproteobacteria bacterium]
MKQTRLIFIALVLLAFAACAGADVKTDAAASGQTAADFTLPDQDGKMWTLAETLKDYKAVVLAFYPKDDTGA